MAKQITITLSDLQMEQLKGLAAHMRGADIEQVVRRCVEQGIYQFEYRYERNKGQWQAQKEQKAKLAALEARLKEIESKG